MRVRTIPILKFLVVVPAVLAVLAEAESFAHRDILWILCPKVGIVISSSAGRLQVLGYAKANRDGWSIQHERLPAPQPDRIDPLFQFHVYNTALDATFPHWFLVLLLGAPGMIYLLLKRKPIKKPIPKLPSNKLIDCKPQV